MLTLPPRWNYAADPYFAGVSRGPSLLLLDYDGTMAPFQDDRMQALPWPGIAERLDELSAIPAVQLALITGRSARELASLVPVHRPIEIWGSHGREHLSREGVYTVSELAPAQLAALDLLEAALRDAGFADQVERKPASLAAHWRTLNAEDAAQMERITREVFQQAGEAAGLRLLVFDGGIEMRSEAIHKGHAVLHMVMQHPTATAAFLGDDVTDEDAFAALRGRGITLLVREQPRPSQASWWLRPPDDLLSFLDAWIEAARRAVL